MLKNTGLPSAKAEDCAIQEINPSEVLISNIDIFTAIHDDPYIMGQIAACNVTNDLFALNALSITNYSNFMGIPYDMPSIMAEKTICGIRDFLKPLGADVDGGHTIYNPWPLFGGSASSIMQKKDLIRKQGAKEGDVILLTKPLGVQPIMGAYRILNSEPELLGDMNLDSLRDSIDIAVKCMTTSNQPVCEVIHEGKFSNRIHGMTDVTGFGFTGHLREILYESGLGAEVRKFPVIKEALELAELLSYELVEGLSPEISGGMLMVVDSSIASDLSIMLQEAKIPCYKMGIISSKYEDVTFNSQCEPIVVPKYD
ncbi:Selenide, water dikinase [Candidatus Lokiarchaeum ossiferum]|uniref:Selenide, water dikinase n=1 Tax=Candidatus Lokiarchaeum ossiferum TaxID=2951803 RepID=A0ABY6HMT5_9ARCH|nr:Selenide, water dikinase [Candidatus Lokiarchaeum sp. B-35]